MSNDSRIDLFSFHLGCFDNVVSGQEPGCISKAFLESHNLGRFVSHSNWPKLCGVCGGEVGDGNSIYLGFNEWDGDSDL